MTRMYVLRTDREEDRVEQAEMTRQELVELQEITDSYVRRPLDTTHMDDEFFPSPSYDYDLGGEA